MNRILLVEDDIALSNGIVMALRDEQTELVQCASLQQARECFVAHCVQLVILDVNLPDGNGLTLLKEIRETSSTPIIVLTANDTETDIVAGLEMGADDYVTKPFSLAILRARVNAQLRKRGSANASYFQQSGFAFDFDAMLFCKENTAIELSKTEQKLLRLLVENRGRTLERSMLVDRIWTDSAEYVDENALSVTVKRLRNTLGDDTAKPRYIKTVYGIGYTWAVE